jgi:hypothetical protein
LAANTAASKQTKEAKRQGKKEEAGQLRWL